MTKSKIVLGRGLDALIRPKENLENKDSSLESNPLKESISHDTKFIMINIEDIEHNPFQPRTIFEPEKMDELKKSILMNGLIQPVTVRLHDGKYQLVSGERRLRACRDIGYREIPAYIIKVLSDEAMLAIALIENIQRERLNAIEIAHAYKRLMDECKLSYDSIAEKVGKDRTTVVNSIRLLKLPLEVQDAIVKEEISMGHARALINLNNPMLLKELVNKIKSEHLSVRKIEQLVKKYIQMDQNNHSIRPVLLERPQKDVGISSVEDNLRKIFATKIICRHNSNGSGYIQIEFYSSDELERLLELLQSIET